MFIEPYWKRKLFISNKASSVFFLEIKAFIFLLSLIVIVLGHIAQPEWKMLFLYDGDSLTLPLLMKALLSKEPLQWISSAQSMLFPEFLIYSLCYFLTPSIEASLVLNAAINLILLYIGLRFILRQLELEPRIRIALAFLTLILFMALMLLEEEGNSSIATYYLFNTYYYGIILIGLYLLGVSSFLLNKERLNSKEIFYFICMPILVTSLSLFSNPMLIVQILIPLSLSLSVVAFLTAGLNKRVGLILLSFFIAMGLGFTLRFFYVDFLGQTLSDHINLNGSIFALKLLKKLLLIKFSGLKGGVFLFLMVFAQLFCLGYTLKGLKKGILKNERIFFLLAIFAVFQFAICLSVFVLSGKIVLRYYLPLVLFPFIGLWPFWLSLSLKKTFLKPVLFLIMPGILIAGLISSFSINTLFSAKDLPGLRCFNQTIPGHNSYGVGHYWLARALNLYNQKNAKILQTSVLFQALPWQDNLGSYRQKKLQFVLATDDEEGWYRNGGLSSSEVNLFIGKATKIIYCPPIKIHYFAEDSAGFKKLNQKFNASYKKIVALRNKHQLYEFFKNV